MKLLLGGFVLCYSLFALCYENKDVGQPANVKIASAQLVQAKAALPIKLAVVSNMKKTELNDGLMPILQQEMEGCLACSIINLTPYSDDGVAQFNQILTVLDEKKEVFQIIYFDFNLKMSSEYSLLSKKIQKLIDQGVIVVSAAGQPMENQSSQMLGNTLFGQIPKALVIGEIGEKDRLIGQSFYGPQMLTALRGPKDHVGQGYAPAIFVGNLAKNFHKRSDWLAYFQEKKMSNKKIWLLLSDLF